jgi:REP element-mobilizing transposase RayT
LALDRQLDSASLGPLWLKDPRLARLVADSLRFGESELGLYQLRAWVVMANHVHLVVFPQAPLWRITKAIKGYTARQANQLLGRTGRPFWQHESFDRWVRDCYELERIVRYVEANPVKAALVRSAEEWPWSSAAVPSGRLDKSGDISHSPTASLFRCGTEM